MKKKMLFWFLIFSSNFFFCQNNTIDELGRSLIESLNYNNINEFKILIFPLEAFSSLIEENDKEMIVIFKDNGQGIASENLEKIFDPFFTTNREHGGTGLGLNIIYNIVTNNLNGSLSCESKEEQGTIFTIVIPTNKKGLKC